MRRHFGGCGRGRHGHVVGAPGGAAHGGHGGGGHQHGVCALRIGLREQQRPVLGRAVGAHRRGLQGERASAQRGGIVDGEGNRLAQPVRMLHHRLHRRGSGHAAKRANHVPVGRAASPRKTAWRVRQRLQAERRIKRMVCHGRKCAFAGVFKLSCARRRQMINRPSQRRSVRTDGLPGPRALRWRAAVAHRARNKALFNS